MTKRKLLFVSCLLLFIISSFAQVIPKDQPSSVTAVSAKDLENIFSRGTNIFTIQQNLSFVTSKPENSDNSTRIIGLTADYNRVLVDGFALGAEVNLGSSRTEVGPNDISRVNVIKGYANAIYGSDFNGAINLYAKASVGVGSIKNKYTNFPTSKDDLFAYRFEIGSPIHLFNDGGNHVTPYIRYEHLQAKDEDGSKDITNEFSLGLKFENYSPCSGYQCDCKHKRSHSLNMYDKGRNFIDYTSFGQFGFGKEKFEFNNVTQETDISGGSLNFDYGHYFARDIALGAGINWSTSKEEIGNNEYTSSQFSFMPMVRLNAPAKDCLENLFLQAGYGFGFRKDKSGQTEDKDNTSELCISLGFNHFFGKHLPLTPKIGYYSETFKNTDTNIKYKYSGFEFGFGCSINW